MSEVALRVKHILTAYHWRYNRRRRGSSLAICSCGWKCRMFRRIDRRSQLRGLLCILPGHDWGEINESHAGPVDFDESEDTLLSRYRQCERCWRCEDVK